MADQKPQTPWDYLIEKSGGATTEDTYNEYEKAIAAGDYDTAAELYDQACRDAS